MKRGQSPGPERYVLALALLVPLGCMLWLVAQMPSVGLAAPTHLVPNVESASTLAVARRPQPSDPAPPPTLAPPTSTPRPTPTTVPTAVPTATPQHGRTYTVQRGDELRHIAADYGVSIWKIIQS